MRFNAAGPLQVSDVRSPAAQVSALFDFQSYFDSTLLAAAILTQAPNEAIVNSTLTESQVRGYAIGLHPSSQTPVAVEFLGADRFGSGGPYILTPGQIIRPLGNDHPFRGIRWGLPYGWLGGGLATLIIFTSPETEVGWAANTEVIFHRARYEIKQPAQLTAAGSFNNAPKNWPLRFPWPQALRGASSFPQKGQPIISIANPTRIIMGLTGLTTLAVATTMRMVWQGSNDLSLNSAGAIVTTPVHFKDINWPPWTSLGTSGNLSAQRPILQFADEHARLAADDGGVLFIDASGAETLSGGYVDVVRYGTL